MSVSPSVHVAGRIAASLIGVWMFTWGFVAFGISALVSAGLPYDDATTLLYLLAFIVFLVLFLWTYTASSLRRVWLVLAGSGGAMTLAAWLITRSLT